MELTWRYTQKIVKYQQPVLIYNPTAGRFRRSPERILHRTTEALARASLHPQPLPTRAPGDATKMARQAIADGADLILVLGGDGTINEVVNGMAHSRVPLGILPGGTANVLAMELGLGGNAAKAVERLSGFVERRVALGKLWDGNGTSRHFLAMGGVGLDAKIVYDINPGFKARAGKVAYWLTGLGHAGQSVGQFDARINGDVYRCGFALASRVRNYGGDLEIATEASLVRDDFEIVLFEGSNPLRYLWYMGGVLFRQLPSMKGVRRLRAGHVEFSGDVHLQVDGEYAGRVPASFEIVPGALTLLMPGAYK
ncbi:MAG: diacylglycerol kinase family protein [Bryobacteraceae bacterium]|jgi:YegS/Rv2252/BmrU family lipid kinase